MLNNFLTMHKNYYAIQYLSNFKSQLFSIAYSIIKATEWFCILLYIYFSIIKETIEFF